MTAPLRRLFKRPKKQKSGGERERVNLLLAALKKNAASPLFIFVDRDSGVERHTRSGFDFCLTYKGQTVFVEAKSDKGKLSPFQELTRRQVDNAGGRFIVCRFTTSAAGKACFELSTSSVVQPIADARPERFF